MRPEPLRLATFVVVLAFLQVGPVANQLLHRRPPPFTTEWRMYTSRGREVCKVSWFDLAGGEPVPVDVMALVHPGATPSTLPRRVRALTSVDDVRHLARQACRKRPRLDLRADAWCGVDRSGAWAAALSAEEPLCR